MSRDMDACVAWIEVPGPRPHRELQDNETYFSREIKHAKVLSTRMSALNHHVRGDTE